MQKRIKSTPQIHVSNATGPGRNPNALAARLVVKIIDDNNKKSWRCIAKDCNHIRQGNAQLDRILKHSVVCKSLRESHQPVWQEAINASCDGSLGARIERGDEKESTDDTQANGPPKKLKGQGTLELGVYRALGKKEKEEQRKFFQAKVDHVIMRLICVRGLIPHIIDSPEWKELMGLLNGSYHPTSSDIFSDRHIPSEAVFVREKQIEILRGIDNLTLTFDGNTTRKPHSIYTVHATTPSRVTYFLDAHEGSSERHTQEWVTNKLLHVRYFQKYSLSTLILCLDNPLDW
jgi:hypothetical protein